MLDWLGLNRHVSDADLAAVWADTRLGETAPSAAAAHVRDCAACRARLASLSSWLESVRTEARQEADEAFPRERLVAQQAQILRRLEGMERPARVLAFPRFPKGISVRQVGRQRWITAAAAAGLVVGIGLGQTLDFRRVLQRSGNPSSVGQLASGTPGSQPVNRPGTLTANDEALLYDRDPSLLAERIPESLRSLHEITPSARDYDPR